MTSRVLSKPLVAAVEGWALAGGFEIRDHARLRLGRRGAQPRFGLPEVTRGLLAAAGGLTRLRRRISYRAALEVARTGQPIDASEAWWLGLVNRVVDDGTALSEALEIAAVFGRNAPMAVKGAKRLLSKAVGEPVQDTGKSNSQLIRRVSASTDAHEGAAALPERRAPVWRGHGSLSATSWGAAASDAAGLAEEGPALGTGSPPENCSGAAPGHASTQVVAARPDRQRLSCRQPDMAPHPSSSVQWASGDRMEGQIDDVREGKVVGPVTEFGGGIAERPPLCPWRESRRLHVWTCSERSARICRAARGSRSAVHVASASNASARRGR